MSEDIQGEAVPPRRRRPRPPDDDDYGPEPDVLDAPFPGTVTAAGVIWIVFGSLVLLNLVRVLFAAFVLAAGRPAAAGAAAGGALCATAFIGLVGGAFLFVGVQSVRGTARDTLGNGVGSIILGSLCGGTVLVGTLAAAQLAGQGIVPAFGESYLGAAISVGESLALVTAGVLALVGRSSYRLWKRAQRDQRERERAERMERRRFRE